jgi:hypothetical protein
MAICFALLFPCLIAFGKADTPAPKEPAVTVEFLRDVLESQLDSVRSLSATYSISQKALSEPARDWGPFDYELHVDRNRVSVFTNQHDPAVPPRRYTFDGKMTYEILERGGRSPQIELFAERRRNLDVADRPLDPLGARVLLADMS